MTDSGNHNNLSSQPLNPTHETSPSTGAPLRELSKCGKVPSVFSGAGRANLKPMPSRKGKIKNKGRKSSRPLCCTDKNSFASIETTAHHEPVQPVSVAHRSSQVNPHMIPSDGTGGGGLGPSQSAPPPSAMNMEGLRSALPGYQPNMISYDQYHHMQSQFAVQSPGVYYPIHPAPSFRGGEQATDSRLPAYLVPYPVVYPQYFPQPHQQPSYPGFPTYVHSPPPHPGVNAPMFGQTAGYGSGFYPSPYQTMLGHSPGPPPRPQMSPRSGSQHSDPRRPTSSGPAPTLHPERPRRPTPKRAATSDSSKTIVDGSNPMKSARSGLDSRLSGKYTTS